MTAGARTAVAEDTRLGGGGLQKIISADHPRFVGDEAQSRGGLELGRTPHKLLAASLAAWAAQTLRRKTRAQLTTLGTGARGRRPVA